jgi:hypothetical protein
MFALRLVLQDYPAMYSIQPWGSNLSQLVVATPADLVLGGLLN